ncbi:MAG: C-GCAxxG-C-C family protein [bacterium]|nr:C-GCAxxG-C-C family protein [bacterium]
MNNADKAVDFFRQGYACSQAVLAAYAPELGLDQNKAARIAAGFASGMRLGDVCGAATGAFMVLGLALCGEDCIAREGRAGVAAAVSTFADRFRERVGALNCPDIIGCDVSTPEGRKKSIEEGLFATKCAPAVRIAAEILEEMLPKSNA